MTEPKDDIIASGLDIGTMNIILSMSNTNQFRTMRNVFLPVSEEEIDLSELNDISYVRDDGGEIYILGQDAFTFCNIFGKKVNRPMESGLISPKEISAIDVLTLMVKNLFGNQIKNKKVVCSYSIPAEAIDEKRSVIYHEKVFGKILSSLGIEAAPINEAMAVIYSETAAEGFSGIGISFGAGLSNVALSYKGVEMLSFSMARGGDWIDGNVGESLGIIPNRATNIKEKHLDLTNIKGVNKKTKRILEALSYYYNSLINYTIKKIISEFNEKVDTELDGPIPIVISGGTSLPNGFLEMFKKNMDKHDLPFGISEIKRAKDPLTAVSNGLLVKTLSTIKKEKKK